jgi:hypothetical protein
MRRFKGAGIYILSGKHVISAGAFMHCPMNMNKMPASHPEYML